MRALVFLIVFLSCQSAYTQCWNLVWADEFSGTSLEQTKWSFQTGAGGWGNNELQYYTDRAENTSVSEGILTITAMEEPYMGAGYTSSRIRTINKGDWTYGKIEASMRLPFGQGIWPAFWMLPTHNVYGGWPTSGEMDIMELVGHQPATAHGTFHYGTPADHQFSGASHTLPVGDYSDAFHTFSMEWEPTEIRWYVDGQLYFSRTPSDIVPYTWVFNEDFHILLNVAVGGNWPGNPDASTTFPQAMEVDYVRVYQQLEDIKISGPDLVEPGTTGQIYSLPDIPSTSYSWTPPPGATIVSGQNTHEITLDWASMGGSLNVDMGNACGNVVASLEVEVSSNQWRNPGFENDFAYWSTVDNRNGSDASFNIDTSLPFAEAKSSCVEVTGTGVNPWDVQLSRSGVVLEISEQYSLSFFAKADLSGKQISVAFINASDFTYYSGTTFTLTDSWASYTHDFTASVANNNILFNIDLGHSTGTYCFDEFVFGRLTALPVEIHQFYSILLEGNTILLNWNTEGSDAAARFEVERSFNGRDFVRIGVVPAGESNKTYSFLDSNPAFPVNYYRLKYLEVGEKSYYSGVIVQETKKNIFSLLTNPVKEVLILRGEKHSEFINCRIYNYLGQKVRDYRYSGQQFIEIPVSHLPEGMYYLHLSGNEFLQTLPFVKN